MYSVKTTANTKESTVSNHSQKNPGSFFKPLIQARLSINQPNDIYEQEADAMSEKVMQRDGRLSNTSSISKITPFFSPGVIAEQRVQRTCESCEKEQLNNQEPPGEKDKMIQLKGKSSYGRLGYRTFLQRKCSGCDKKKKLLRKSDSFTPSETSLKESDLQKARGSGSPLPKNIRKEMESSFGADFSKVNIHTGSKASEISTAIGAHAFTHGNDIFFNEGKYNTGTGSGKKLLAHELTHVIQQNSPLTRRRIQRSPDLKSANSGTSFIINQPYNNGQIQLNGGERVYLVLDLSAQSKIVQLPPPYALAYKPFEIPAWYLELSPTEENKVIDPTKAKEIFQSETRDQFVNRVYTTAIERCRLNISNLNSWKSYLNAEFTDAIALRGQLRGVIANDLYEQAVSRGRGVNFENWCRTRQPGQRRVEERVMRGEIKGGCEYCHQSNFERQKDFEFLEKNGLGNFRSQGNVLEALKSDAAYTVALQFNKGFPGTNSLTTWPGNLSQLNVMPAPQNTISAGQSTVPESKTTAVQAQTLPVAAPKTDLFCPEPKSEQIADPPAMQNLGPCSGEAFKAIQSMRVKLEKLGPWPKGYDVLPKEIFTSLYSEPPENIRNMVMNNIEIRINKYQNSIERFGNHEPEYYQLCAIMNELWPTTNESVRKIIEFEKKLRELKEKMDFINTIGLIFLSIIFPPVGILAGALSIYEGYQSYKLGTEIEEAKGAGVFSLSQESQAESLKAGGIMGMFMGALTMGLTVFNLPRWFRGVQQARAANKMFQSLKALEKGGELTIPGVPGKILSRNGRLLFINENNQVIGIGRISQGQIWTARLQNPIDLNTVGQSGTGVSMVPFGGGPMVPFGGGSMVPGAGGSIIPGGGGSMVPFGAGTMVSPGGISGLTPIAPLGQPTFMSATDPLNFVDIQSGPAVTMAGGNPTFLPSLVESVPGSRGIMIEPGDYMLGYGGITTVNARDLAFARMLSQNLPQWPQSVGAIGQQPLPWNWNPALSFPATGPVRVLTQPGLPGTTPVPEAFFPPVGGAAVPGVPRLVPINQLDVTGLRPSTHPQLYGQIERAYWRRPFALTMADPVTRTAMGQEIGKWLRPGGFIEFRILRGGDEAVALAVAQQIPHSRIVIIPRNAILSYSQTGVRPAGLTDEQWNILDEAGPDIRNEFGALGEGVFARIIRIYRGF